LYIWSGNNKKYKYVYPTKEKVRKIAERTRAKEEKIAPSVVRIPEGRWGAKGSPCKSRK